MWHCPSGYAEGSREKPLKDVARFIARWSIRPERANQHQHAVTEEVMRQVQLAQAEQPVEVEFVERTPQGRLWHALSRRLLPRPGEK